MHFAMNFSISMTGTCNAAMQEFCQGLSRESMFVHCGHTYTHVTLYYEEIKARQIEQKGII